ncbi:hypothetical protein [Planomonospora sp. ID82291]|uniref:hypothetical protein n=1 Tax=Planomonospora sp. ID82291 TaxID=2738136 RepID=UPI0018C3AD74|nr:hypothetical protein [Planomonospora sp. ID82291]MBG0819056.1 hypothetical protein [Planomonospora sp. ID82291]
MSPNPSPLVSTPWPILLVGAFLFIVLVVAFLLYAIAKAAINKADAQDLPHVLAEIAQMIRSTARPLHRALHAAQNASVLTPVQTQQNGGQSTTGTGATQ